MFLKKKIILILFGLSLIFVFLNKNQNNSSENQIGGNFELTNHLGQKVTNESFNGYYRLVFFGFTNCPDFCPNTLNDIGIVIDEIDKNHLLVPIFITVDPQRDTVLKLKNYLTNFHPNIIGLSGTNLQINDVKKKYKIFSKKVMEIDKKNKNVQDHHNDHDHGGYGVDHTTIIYLMDKKGNYLTHFSPDTTNTQLVKKINQYL